MSDFSTCREEIKSNEQLSDSLLTQYSELVSNPPPNVSETEQQLEQLLATRKELVAKLTQLADVQSASPIMRRQADRHLETLKDHQSANKRLASEISLERNRRSLLSSVRQDIQSHRASTTVHGEEGLDDSLYYQNESRRVDHSRSLADSLLTSAYEARAELQRQQRLLGDVQRRMLSVLARVPGINTLISKINTRQKRNSLVLATLIVLGVLFIVFVR